MPLGEISNLEGRLKQLNESIDEALKVSLRNRSGLTLVAVSKRQPVAAVRQAYELGLREFGESQVQEAVPKAKVLPEDIIWHYIGHLQKNKVRKAVQFFPYIHSIDSLSLLQRVDKIAAEERVKPKVFLQVNYALDPDKFGLHPEAVETVLDAALDLTHIECVGLMGIPPLDYNGERCDTYFSGIAKLRDKLKERFPDWPGKLSLGMSSDFACAIKQGSNYIRVGSTLFGERLS